LILVKILEHDNDLMEQKQGKEKSIGRLVNEKFETFFKCLSEVCERHRSFYSIPDVDLKEQMRDSTVKLVVPVYAEFLESYSGLLQRKVYPSPQRLQGLIGKAFGSNHDWNLNGGRNSGSLETDIRKSR
jgi:exocyst complex protein 7